MNTTKKTKNRFCN